MVLFYGVCELSVTLDFLSTVACYRYKRLAEEGVLLICRVQRKKEIETTLLVVKGLNLVNCDIALAP